jgi:hypothetical protein
VTSASGSQQLQALQLLPAQQHTAAAAAAAGVCCVSMKSLAWAGSLLLCMLTELTACIVTCCKACFWHLISCVRCARPDAVLNTVLLLLLLLLLLLVFCIIISTMQHQDLRTC